MKNKYKLILSFLVVCVLLLATPVLKGADVDFKGTYIEASAAESGTCGDNLTWTLDNEGTLTISGEGAMKDYSSGNIPWSIASIKRVVIEDGVTTIGRYAFCFCIRLTSVTIPDSVTDIGKYAFYGCTKLTKTNYTGNVSQWASIKFDSNESNPVYYSKNLYINDELVTEAVLTDIKVINSYAFYQCKSLTAVTIGDSVTAIGGYAFSDCTGLTSVTIPDSVTDIGKYAFYGCTKLTKTNYTGNVSQWASIKFYSLETNPVYYSGNLYINDELVTEAVLTSVAKINAYAFCGCKSLTTVTIGDSVTAIGYDAFRDCNGLTSVTIPDSVTTISSGVFSGCTGLTSITIPDSVTTIDSSTFYGCTGLRSITIPSSVKTIGDSAFSDCTGLTSVTIPYSVTSISSGVFSGCTGLTSVTISGSVTAIGDRSFYGCTGLTSVTIPDSVTAIGDRSFYGCTGLTSVTIPDSVTAIGDRSFYGCTGLTSVTIPYSVVTIGSAAFKDCDKINVVHYLGSESDWKKVNIDSDNENFSKAALHIAAIINETAPTCTKAGNTLGKKCDVCDIVFVAPEIIPATGHKEEKVPAVAPTCTQDGLTEGEKCSVCNEILTPQQSIAKLGHACDDGVIIKEPTCTEYGIKQFSCIRCENYSYTEVVEKLAHTYGEWITETPANCKTVGIKTKTCSRCSEKVQELIPMTEHEYSDWTVTQAPTCLLAGIKTKTCLNCGDEVEKLLPATGHIFTKYISNNDATCTKDGTKTAVCDGCAKEKDTVIDINSAKGHKLVISNAIPATCTKTGLTTGTYCSVCGDVLTPQKEVAATGHTFENKVTPATPSANGSVVPTCKTCGAKNTATVIYSPKTVETAKASFTYTGKELKPTVLVKDSKGNVIDPSNYDVTYTNNKKIGKATITVTFKGNYSGKLTATFKIVPKGTSVSKLEAKTKGFKATWKKQTKQVTGYEIQYSTSKKFTKKTTKTVKIKDAKTVTATVSKLKAGTKYYVRIRTYKTVGKTNYYSEWSKVKNVKLK